MDSQADIATVPSSPNTSMAVEDPIPLTDFEHDYHDNPNHESIIEIQPHQRRKAKIDRFRIDPAIRLRRAIRSNDPLLVARILKSHPHLLHNPDPDDRFGLSNSNLHLAASLGHLQICRLLVSLGHERTRTADGATDDDDDDDDHITPSLNDNHQTPLMLASAAGHTEVVHYLCEFHPASIVRQDIRGRDAIMEASLHGHDTAVQLLLTYAPGGAERALRNADLDGNTALHFASSNGNLLVLRTLLAAGADASRRNVWQWTAEAYSATVQAEVYLKGLVMDVERRRGLLRTQEAGPQQQSPKRVREGVGVGVIDASPKKEVVVGKGSPRKGFSLGFMGGGVRLVRDGVGD
ncbi:ankyrin repeat-containing domain protein [Cercophora samala]|uniref:Ankyrin repeat-containing domain protein n=1 Tax=Cercophora samala TaxID=330535 RepID=A0AA39YX09_9PEZI|nr:ankyrin repeat-containing domain protein [Cercophora samala]